MRIEKKTRTSLTSHEKFMGIAWWACGLSRDPNYPVGCCIVEDPAPVQADGNPMIFAWNTFPKAISEFSTDWDKDHLVDHAIRRALRLCRRSVVKGSTIYVTTLPCQNCILEAVALEVKKIIYFPMEPDENFSGDHEENLKIAKDLASDGKLTLEEFDGNLNWMRDKIAEWVELGIF